MKVSCVLLYNFPFVSSKNQSQVRSKIQKGVDEKNLVLICIIVIMPQFLLIIMCLLNKNIHEIFLNFNFRNGLIFFFTFINKRYFLNIFLKGLFSALNWHRVINEVLQ